MPDSSKQRRLMIWLTIVSILAGLPTGIGGVVLLFILITGLITGGSMAGHLLQYLIMDLGYLIIGLGAALVGAVSVVGGIYSLISTEGFRRWGSGLPRRDTAIAIAAWIGLALNAIPLAVLALTFLIALVVR